MSKLALFSRKGNSFSIFIGSNNEVCVIRKPGCYKSNIVFFFLATAHALCFRRLKATTIFLKKKKKKQHLAMIMPKSKNK